MKQLFIISIFIFSFLFSCNEEKSDSAIIPEDKFIEIFTDIVLADAYVSYKTSLDFDTRTKNYGYYKSVLDNHNTTMDAFKNSYEFYKDDLNRFLRIHNSVLNKIIRLKSN